MDNLDLHAALHSRVFKGILLSEDISRRELAGELNRSEPAQGVNASLFGDYEAHFSQGLRERAQKMTYAYCLFYCFENSVRELVAQRLEERKGANCWTEAVPSNVQKRVEGKKQEIENNKWHQAVIGADVNFTLFGDLASIIISQWQEFEELFPSQDWVRVRLNELERSRNVIAHGNLLPEPEIERLEQYLDDWLRQVP